ncbi:DnaJ C-terminal domain-containing protein [Rhodoferax lacus]|nr:DnaJ C-terminal domain-containing protein [Rhodoferax lacus]
MDTQEAYAELGLDPSASDAQLKASWRRLVATWHPDRNAATDAGRRMQSINKAYQHIRQLRDGDGDADSESDSDSAASTSASSDESKAQAKAEAAQAETEATDTDAPGKTHVRKVRLSLEDAILGCTRTLRGHFTHRCGTCVGKGQRVLAQACSNCHGSGAVHKPALFGWLWNQEACADCGGDGRQRAACDACEGKGEKSVAYRRRVRFPAGMREGHVLSVPSTQHGELEIGLELQVEIEPHPFFVLDAEGVLRAEVPVNGYAWMAGRWVDVPTPDGMQQMRLNRDALVYRLAGQGAPAKPRGPRGDYLVKVLPVFPDPDDAATVAALDKLIETSSRAAVADDSLPLGEWQRQLKRWNASHKERGAA